MKQVIFAFILITAVCGFIIWHGFHLTDVCGELVDMAKKLPQTKQEFEKIPVQDAEKILELFNKNALTINLSVPFPDIREAELAITDMITYIRTRNFEEYMAARARAILNLETLQDYELPNIHHLL